MTKKLSEIEMHERLIRYCFSVKCDDCRFSAPDGECRWDEKNPKSTEECYRFALREGLIEAPDDAEFDFVKVEDNDEIEHQENDAINHPSHYTYGGIECIDAINAVVNEIPNGICAWLTGQVIKYIWRWMHKNKPVEDLKKCRFYLDRLIENAEVVYGKNT